MEEFKNRLLEKYDQIISELEKEDNKDDKYDAVERVYEKLWEILNEHNINLDDIVQ
jgi:molecular chaperone GrpE (heat shock protein)